MEPQYININFDHIIEILRKGIRRADIFMGIGLNASTHDPAIPHVLSAEGFHHINLVKEQLSAEEKAHVALEFGKWVRSNGLRELIETFSVFCDELYAALFVIHLATGKEDKELLRPEQFEPRGIKDKLDALTELIEVSEGDRRVLRSLNQARNCYAHRQGRVGARDVGPDNKPMKLVWNAFQVEAKEPNGNIVPEDEIVGYLFEEGAMIQLRVIEREKEFGFNTELVLDRKDLKEICLSVLNIGHRFMHQSVELAKELGILRDTVDETFGQPEAI